MARAANPLTGHVSSTFCRPAELGRRGDLIKLLGFMGRFYLLEKPFRSHGQLRSGGPNCCLCRYRP
jgi:hypothetical protein